MGIINLLPITQLRIRDKLLGGYLHIPAHELIDELQEDLKIVEHAEEYELAQAYKDLIDDLETLDWVNE